MRLEEVDRRGTDDLAGAGHAGRLRHLPRLERDRTGRGMVRVVGITRSVGDDHCRLDLAVDAYEGVEQGRGLVQRVVAYVQEADLSTKDLGGFLRFGTPDALDRFEVVACLPQPGRLASSPRS